MPSRDAEFATPSGVTVIRRAGDGSRARVVFPDGKISALQRPIKAERAPGITRMRSVTQAAQIVFEDPQAWGVDLTAPFRRRDEQTVLAVRWAVNRWTAEQMQAWVAAGQTWPDYALTCLGRSIDVEMMRRWFDAGVERSAEAIRWRSVRGTPEDVGRHTPAGLALCLRLNVDKSTGWGILADEANAPFVQAAICAGRRPEATLAFARAITATRLDQPPRMRQRPRLHAGTLVHINDPWSEVDEQAALALARTVPGDRWADFALCVQAGMSRNEALAHVSGGKDMGPVRLLAALT